ncbi:MAG: hypothetical protein VR72_00750 [Clostridiaceae bacterium BRH_c20a]|nr:MAG: hypothetical protein VR72_00750 [Clostridiaceae bacterium BRH_c20a]
MSDLRLENNWKELKCLLPIYDENGGNSTEAWLVGGKKIIIANKTNTVLKNLAKFFALDLSQLKRKYGKLVGRKTSTPLPFHPELILVPFKYREPFSKDEGSRGYVVKKQVSGCTPMEKNQIQINFFDNSYIHCLQSTASFTLVLAQAEIISREYKHNLNLDYEREREEIYRVITTVLSSLGK